MKKFRTDIGKRFEKLDECWRTLPLRKQHKYTLYFFLGYVLLTAGVLFKVCYDTRKSTKDIAIEHIENPVLKKKASPAFLKDTLSPILKK